MSRITLIHWNEREAKTAAARLRELGHTIRIVGSRTGPGLSELRKRTPDMFVIDLSRLPAQGRDVAILLRRQSATRTIPIVFLGGENGKQRQIKKVIPDAVYSDWKKVRSALRDAKRLVPKTPVVPVLPHFYTGVPLVKKLGVKADCHLVLMGAPRGFVNKLGRLPEGARTRTRPHGKADLILVFARSQVDLKKRFGTMERILADGGRFWIIWPKKTSGVSTDLNQTFVRNFGLDAGYVDFKICAVDETWSGLQFTERRK